jgi:RNA polymerase sigma-70 factor (ECF subfamily)
MAASDDQTDALKVPCVPAGRNDRLRRDNIDAGSTMSARRDTDWFMDQVRREQSRLRAFVRALGVRAEAVDDIAQEALLIAYERLAVFRGDEDFGAWVRGIARRLVANWLRKENRRQLILSEHMTELLAASAPEQLHPLAETGHGERLEALQSCLEQLPEQGRQLIHLRYFEELSPGAIASRWDRPANDVRQQLFRLRRALLRCIEFRLALLTPGGES